MERSTEIRVGAKRPTVGKVVILAAAEKVAAGLGKGADAETIADNYRPYMDGYELARQLDRYCGWGFTMAEVEALDEMTGIVMELQRDAEKTWAAAYNIQPKLPIGTTIKQGVIAGVCEHSAAKYRVKEHGCEQKGRFLLINFEDAEAA